MDKKDELEMFVLDNVYEVIEIGFLDHKIKTVIDEYQNIWISVESICDHLKIDSEKEIESLIDSDLDVWILKVFDSNLGKYNLFMINIDSIKLWLNTIHFNYILFTSRLPKFESLGILIKYRSKIIDVIKTAINDKKIVTDKIIEEKETSIIEDHFEGEELVGRVVIETEGEKNKDEEVKDGGAKLPVIEVEEKGTVKCGVLEEEKMKDEGEKMQEIISQVFHGVFEDNPIATFIYGEDQRPCWIASDIGVILGYSGDGRRLVNNISKEWANEFKEGKHYIVLKGKKLKSFKEFIGLNTNSVFGKRTSQIMLLFEPGIYHVCQKTDKPIGAELRDFLTDKILPKLARGQNIIVKEEEKKGVWIPEMSVEALGVLMGQVQRAQEAEGKVLRLEGKIEEDKEYVNLAKTYEAEGSIKLSKFVHEGDGMGRLKYTFGEKIIYKYAEYHGMIKWGSMDNKMKWLPRSKYREWFAMVRDPIIAKKGRELHVTGYGRRKLVDFILNDPDAKYWSREKGSAELRRKYLRRNKDNQLSFKDKIK